MICGVCGGLAEYLGADPALVRRICAVFCLVGGTGMLVYFAAACILPEKPEFIDAEV